MVSQANHRGIAMKRLRHFVGLTAVLGLMATAALAAGAPDLSGTWTASFDSQVGKQDYTYTLKVEGGKLTGHAKSNLGEGEITDGKVDKDMVSFIEHLNYQGMMLDITYTGKIVSADEIQFKRDVGGQGGEEFTAKRKKDK
jgi:hypothetical protein